MMEKVQESLRIMMAKNGRHGISINYIRPIFMRKIQTYTLGQMEWHPFDHVAIAHQPLIMFEQWKASRHQLL